MGDYIYKLMSSTGFTWFNWILTIVLTILFFAYALSKEGRDEHGRAIVGTACFHGVIGIIVFMNVLCYYMYIVIQSVAVFANAIRLVYDGFLAVTLLSILILRKIR
ncbi:hypothetical protein ABMC10_02880 [Anaerostipes caccae]